MASTAGLQRLTRPSERVAAQSATDLLMNCCSGASSFLAALALANLGWRGMHLFLFAVSGAILVVVVGAEGLSRSSKETVAAAPAGAEEAKQADRL